eukprot:642622-Prorocentrum_minimum.AAC.1
MRGTNVQQCGCYQRQEGGQEGGQGGGQEAGQGGGQEGGQGGGASERDVARGALAAAGGPPGHRSRRKSAQT